MVKKRVKERKKTESIKPAGLNVMTIFRLLDGILILDIKLSTFIICSSMVIWSVELLYRIVMPKTIDVIIPLINMLWKPHLSNV